MCILQVTISSWAPVYEPPAFLQPEHDTDYKCYQKKKPCMRITTAILLNVAIAHCSVKP